MGLSYRFLQFQRALLARPAPGELARAEKALTSEQFSLFLCLQPSEQAHSLRIFHALSAEGQTDPDLLAAALLHDVGKCQTPLKIWERVMIVLLKAIFPKKAERLGGLEPTGWRRPLAVARQHPAWGAAMVAQSGGSDLLVELIRHHQDTLPEHPATEADRLLALLKKYDDQT